jgi:hypothetical protein
VPGGVADAYRREVMRWEGRALRHINRNIGYVPGTVEHLFHGRKTDRGYQSRWDMFVKHDFDPLEDLKRNSSRRAGVRLQQAGIAARFRSVFA